MSTKTLKQDNLSISLVKLKQTAAVFSSKIFPVTFVFTVLCSLFTASKSANAIKSKLTSKNVLPNLKEFSSGNLVLHF